MKNTLGRKIEEPEETKDLQSLLVEEIETATMVGEIGKRTKVGTEIGVEVEAGIVITTGDMTIIEGIEMTIVEDGIMIGIGEKETEIDIATETDIGIDMITEYFFKYKSVFYM